MSFEKIKALQEKIRQKQAQHDAKVLQTLRKKRIRAEGKAFRVSRINKERMAILKARNQINSIRAKKRQLIAARFKKAGRFVKKSRRYVKRKRKSFFDDFSF